MKKLLLYITFIEILFCLCSSSIAQKIQQYGTLTKVDRPTILSDSALLDIVQRQTFNYFWDFAHPVSGMARERSNVAFNYGEEVVTTGGTGFGVMATIVATERK